MLATLLGVACGGAEGDADGPREGRVVARAIAGLSEAQTARFQAGTEEFLEVDSSAEGLGPLFNGASCSHCHSIGGLGGGGTLRVTRAVCRQPNGAMTGLPADSGIELLLAGSSTAAEVTDLSGRGVGVAAVQQVARSLGGELDVYSEPGRGSRFVVVVPLRGAKSYEPSPSAYPPNPKSHNGTTP